MTPETWLAGIKQQVVTQYKLVKQNPGMNGFTAAFTAPMTITGSAKIFTIYTSKEVFNGQVTIKFSTDGKFVIIGKLNFASDNISISGRLYADLSRVATGDVVVLFLADVPDQVRLLTVYGKLKMGFRNASGEEVTFDVVDPGSQTATETAPSATLVDPIPGRTDINIINGRIASGTTHTGTIHTDRPYIDVIYNAPPGANLDLSSILDSDSEFAFIVGGQTVAVDGTPVPVTSSTGADGTVQFVPVTATTEEQQGATPEGPLSRRSSAKERHASVISSRSRTSDSAVGTRKCSSPRAGSRTRT
jgi:hypothetical protein